MSIEISQLSINTTISNQEKTAETTDEASDTAYRHQELDIERLRQSILADCKSMIYDTLQRQQER